MLRVILKKKAVLFLILLMLSHVFMAQIQWSGVNFISRNTSEVGVADVDQDGFNDILVAGSQQRWYSGPAFNTWHVIGTSNGGPYAAQVADINNDGWMDFVTSDGARVEADIPGHTYVYLNPGATGPVTDEWERIVVYQGNVRHQNDIDIMDLDGDGLLDIVTRSWSEEKVVVALQNPDINNWTVRPFLGTAGLEEGLSVGDIDGDGEIEIVLSGVYWDNPGGWRTGPPIVYSVDPNFVGNTYGKVKSQVGDIDNDGDNDIYMASAEGADRYMAWYENEGLNPDGSVILTKHIIKDNSGKFHMVQLIDVDQDGDLDMCTGRSFGQNGLFVFYNNNNGASWTEQNYDTSGEIYTGVVADLDADGDLDVVGPSKFNNGSIRYYLNETPVNPPVAPSNLSPSLVDGLQINLTWNDLSDNETQFEIERFDNGVWSFLSAVGSNITSFIDDSTEPGTSYQYRIRSVNVAGNSDWINSESIITYIQAGSVNITPGSGDYVNPPLITLSAVLPYDDILYTTDGSDPVINGNSYSAPFVQTNSAEILAVAVGDQLIPSSIAQENYNVAVNGNFAPEADAGEDFISEINTVVLLNGSTSSDIDDPIDSLIYDWVLISGPSITINNSDQSIANFSSPIPGNYLFQLSVSDEISVDQDQILITLVDPNAIIGPTPIAYWPMDDGNGNIVTEEINGLNGTLNSGSIWSNTGQVNGSILFDGIQGRASIGNIDVSETAMSISFWMNATDLSQVEGRMVSKANGISESQHDWMISQINGSGLRFRLKTSINGTTTLASSPGEIVPGEWYYIVGTYDGSTMKIYKNSVLISSTNKSGIVAQSGTTNVAIGNQPVGAGDRPFKGLLDEVKLYDEALSQEVISEIYNAELNSNTPIFFNLSVMLEGPFDSQLELMKDELRIQNQIPLEQPYSVLGYSVPFATTSTSLLSITGPSAIVDWVLVELRDGSDPSSVLESQACLLQRDGVIISSQGSPVGFNISQPNVYVAVRHRNHLGLRTTQSYSTTGSIDIDFSNVSTDVFGFDSSNIINGKRVLISGDANADGQINTIDKNSFWRIQNAQTYDYISFLADFNMDGLVNAVDRNSYWRPNNSKVEQLD